jgi:putative tryptophan/tyrosine transport system substrate-binding protein
MQFDRLGRREFITFLGGAAVSWPVGARAQQGGPAKRVGYLSLSSSKDQENVVSTFLDGLHSHGLIEGRTLNIDYRYSDGDVKRLTPLAQELIALRPDVLVGAEPSPAKVLRNIAPALPIVCPLLTDAQLSDLVASYARPGGNVTGLATTVEGLTGKLIELVQEFIPGAARVGFLANSTGASMQYFAHTVEEAARGRGIMLLTEQAATQDDLPRALGRLAQQQTQAIIVPLNGLFRNEVAQIVQLATAARLPTIFAEPHGPRAGGLASYGIDQKDNYRRAADYVDKILKGAKPADMPIEFPTKIELVINLKAARTLGMDVPLFLQQRADEIIE